MKVVFAILDLSKSCQLGESAASRSSTATPPHPHPRTHPTPTPILRAQHVYSFLLHRECKKARTGSEQGTLAPCPAPGMFVDAAPGTQGSHFSHHKGLVNPV